MRKRPVSKIIEAERKAKRAAMRVKRGTKCHLLHDDESTGQIVAYLHETDEYIVKFDEDSGHFDHQGGEWSGAAVKVGRPSVVIGVSE